MTRAINSLIDLDATPFYHVISRCVRRAFLCGEDNYSGKNYNHRRQWVFGSPRVFDNSFKFMNLK